MPKSRFAISRCVFFMALSLRYNPHVPTAFSVTISVTPTPYPAPALWADAPSELLPFDIARKSSAQEVLSQVFWREYFGAGLERAHETVRSHPAMHDLPPPPSEWQYPRLTIAMPPHSQWGGVQHWEGMGKPTSAVAGFNRLYKALRSDPEALGAFRKAVVQEVGRIGLLAPRPIPPHPILHGDFFEVGRFEFYPRPPQDSLAGWVWSTFAVRFWVQLLSYPGGEVDGVLRAIGHELSNDPDQWDRYYAELKEERPGDDDRWLIIEPVPLIELTARVLQLHGGRKYLNRARVCEYLREAGLRGVVIPPPTPWLYNGTLPGPLPPEGAYTGAYHLALLELSRKTGPRACAHCGASFIPARSTARYCSGACRMAAHRSRERTNK